MPTCSVDSIQKHSLSTSIPASPYCPPLTCAHILLLGAGGAGQDSVRTIDTLKQNGPIGGGGGGGGGYLSANLAISAGQLTIQFGTSGPNNGCVYAYDGSGNLLCSVGPGSIGITGINGPSSTPLGLLSAQGGSVTFPSSNVIAIASASPFANYLGTIYPNIPMTIDLSDSVNAGNGGAGGGVMGGTAGYYDSTGIAHAPTAGQGFGAGGGGAYAVPDTSPICKGAPGSPAGVIIYNI